MSKVITPGMYSWGILHRKTPNERVKIVTELLHAARRDGAPFIKKDGTITVRDKGLLFAKFFTGDVDVQKAKNLADLLVRHGVLKSNGQRGRGGATLTLLDPKSLPNPSAKKKVQPEEAAVSKASDSSEPERLPAENSAPQPIEELKVRQVRERIHRELNAARHEAAAATEHLGNLEAADRILSAFDDNADLAALKGALGIVRGIFE